MPENPRRRWFTAARSHTNYRPEPQRYPGLRPPAPLEDGDSFNTVVRAVATAGLDLTAWIVLFHSSLANAHPELAVRPLGGPPQPGALCPSNPAVVEYAVALAREIDERFAPAAFDLETIGWATLPHHHHAKLAVPLGPSGRYLLSLCFCNACRELASPDLPGWATSRLEAELRGTAPTVAVDELISGNPELAAFQAARERTVVELVRAVAETVSARVHVAHWGEPRQAALGHAAVAAVADRLVILDYGQGGQAPGATVDHAARLVGGDRIVAGLSVCAPETPDEQTFRSVAAAAAALGIDAISVYNHSLVDRVRLRWARANA